MMETTSSGSKAKLGRSGKVLVTALTPRTKEKPTKYKMERYDIRNVSKKDFVNKIKGFEKFVKVPHFKKEPKHEPTSSYLHLVKCLRKCIMRSGDHKQNVYNSYEKETAPSSNVDDTKEEESK